jgi:hypothetical protein
LRWERDYTATGIANTNQNRFGDALAFTDWDIPPHESRSDHFFAVSADGITPITFLENLHARRWLRFNAHS